MDPEQGVTLMEIYRMVVAIRSDVAVVVKQGNETLAATAAHHIRIDQVEHDIRSLKQNSMVKTRIVSMTDSVTVKQLIALVIALAGAVSGLVAYFKG